MNKDLKEFIQIDIDKKYPSTEICIYCNLSNVISKVYENMSINEVINDLESKEYYDFIKAESVKNEGKIDLSKYTNWRAIEDDRYSLIMDYTIRNFSLTLVIHVSKNREDLK